MNPDPAQTQREQMEVRLVALLLGEASPFEEAELVKAMQQDPSLTAFYTEMLATLGLLREASKQVSHADEAPAPPIAQPKLSAERRAALLAHLKQPAQKPAEAPAATAAPVVVAVKGEPIPLPTADRRMPRWVPMGLRLAALFIVLGVLAALLLPALSTAKMKARSMFAMQEMVNAPVQTSPTRGDALADTVHFADGGLSKTKPDAEVAGRRARLSFSAGGRDNMEQSDVRYFHETVRAGGGAAVVNSPEPREPARVPAVSVFLPQDVSGVEGLVVGQDNGRLTGTRGNEVAEGEAMGRTLNRSKVRTDAFSDAQPAQTDFFALSSLGETSGGMGGAGGGGGFGGGRAETADGRSQVESKYFAYGAKPQAQPESAASAGTRWFFDSNGENAAGDKAPADDYVKQKVAGAPALGDTPMMGQLFKDSGAIAKGGDAKAGEAVPLFVDRGDGTLVTRERNLAQNLNTYSRPVAGKPAAAPAASAGSAGTALNFGLAVEEFKSAAPTPEGKPVGGPAVVEPGKPLISRGGVTAYSVDAVEYAGALNLPAGSSSPAATTPTTAAPPPPPAAQPMPGKSAAPMADRELALKDLDANRPVTRSLSDGLAAGLSSISGPVAPATPPPPPAGPVVNLEDTSGSLGQAAQFASRTRGGNLERKSEIASAGGAGATTPLPQAGPAGTVAVDPASGQVVMLGRLERRDQESALGVDKSLREEPMTERFGKPVRELGEGRQRLAEDETRRKQQVAAGTTSERLAALEKSPQSVAPVTAGRKAAEFDAKAGEELKRQAEVGGNGVVVTDNTLGWDDHDGDGDSDVLAINRSISSRLSGATADAKKSNQQVPQESLGKAAQKPAQLSFQNGLSQTPAAAGGGVTVSTLGDQSMEQLKAHVVFETLDGAKKETAPQSVTADRQKADDSELPKLNKLSEISKAKDVSEARESKSEALAPRPAPAPALLHQPEVTTAENSDVNFSTFSLNVSDVAFKTAAASLGSGALPDPNTVRVEEFINALKYRDPAPAAGAPLAFAWERARHPFAHNRDLLRFSVQTAAQGREVARPLNLVILLDNSGSMERPDRVQILNESLKVLANKLQPQDKISVVAFARTARLWVDGLAGGKPNELMQTVATFNPQGGTDLEAGLNLAYQTALKHFLPNGNNRVIMLTDGAANLGEVEPEALKQKVVAHRQKGISLDCFGIGWEGYADDVLEVLARNGDGRYAFLNDVEQAGAEFAEKLAGALSVAASDVKTQVEFNPQRVTAYRQVGYAKHQLTKQQFRDNTVDAAEIAAAEAGNAMYVIQVNPQGSGPLGVVRVRFKEPATGAYVEKEWTLPYQPQVPALDQASAPMRLASVAATFGEWLARNPYAAEANLSRLAGYMSGVPEFFSPDPRPKQLAGMIQQAMVVSGQK